MRSRLALLVAATTSLVLVAFLVPLALLLRTVAEDRAVGAATDAVQAIVPFVNVEDADDEADLAQSLAGLEWPVTVYLPNGTVLPGPAPRTPAVELAYRGQRSLTVQTPQGREIVMSVGGDAGTAVIRTVVATEELTEGVTQAWLTLAALGVTLVLLGLLVADRLARNLVAPISELSEVSHRLARAELSARARPAGPPELREVANALNHLAGRIQELLRAEREQVADLSHRLRTPLTALRLEAESLPDPADTARVTAGVDAVERAVTGLIRQARWKSGERTAADRHCDATAVVAERLAFWSVLAEDTERRVHRELSEGALPVAVPADDLAAALDALLGNVFAHTPDGTGFTVELRPRPGGGAVLTITDEGPGFPAAGAALLRGASGSGSTGLGLDIARQAAESAGGGLRVGSGPRGGARVRLELPAPASFTSP